MPRRKQILVTDEIYHVFNRSVGSEEILVLARGLARALDLIDYYRFPQKARYSQFKNFSKQVREAYLLNLKEESPLVKIYSFSLMPNHYHLLVKQQQNRGISRFISNFQNSFAKYFNIKNNRHGALFVNPFKAKRIETDEGFAHLSRYIHLNPVTSFLIEIDELFAYPWTSFSRYKDESQNKFIDTNMLIEMFGSREKYFKFVMDQADYQRRLGIVKGLVIG